MPEWTFFYLVRIEFLGFRYHGWQKQEGLKTIHQMVDKTLKFVLGTTPFRSLGCGRTDAKVSAEDYAFELFTTQSLIPEQLVHRLNANLPADIRARSAKEVDAQFNIIQSAKTKTYHYHFCFGEKPHPFSAPLVQHFGKKLDIDSMILAAKQLEGEHDFTTFTSKPGEETQLKRLLKKAIIVENETGDPYMPVANHYIFQATAPGFLRYQVRLMMGALIEIGRGLLTIEELKALLSGEKTGQIKTVAPGSGLRLHRVGFGE
ncbi:MAG: tRNA pseudouridine(38-40) synthase TruA [Cytophagales bacterium]|nr:tRNA pseudouridine(38-40) synthase TruA [Cytophagales bacterium]